MFKRGQWTVVPQLAQESHELLGAFWIVFRVLQEQLAGHELWFPREQRAFAIRSGKRVLGPQFLHSLILAPLRYARSSPNRSLTNDKTAPGADSPSSGIWSTPAGVNCAPRVRLTRCMSFAGSTRVCS